MSPRFFQTSVTLSPLLVALASVVSLELPGPAVDASDKRDVWRACQQQQAHAARGAPAAAQRSDRTQSPTWRRQAAAEMEICLREQLAPPASARRLRPAGAAA